MEIEHQSVINYYCTSGGLYNIQKYSIFFNNNIKEQVIVPKRWGGGGGAKAPLDHLDLYWFY